MKSLKETLALAGPLGPKGPDGVLDDLATKESLRKEIDENLSKMKEEQDALFESLPGEGFADTLWRERVSRLLTSYSLLQNWELD